uniref:Uncharacterized protein n=1 Tax=Guillardia theta TaxID=55529 RepID=A0A7S4HB94_GUITH|mmetsp:Transcript_12901/g.45314  ORF Transcript_12901/g.45314 Transcript_12901/m.45314 type:complete len:128 (+) Transcript_12901:442-825(+)
MVKRTSVTYRPYCIERGDYHCSLFKDAVYSDTFIATSKLQHCLERLISAAPPQEILSDSNDAMSQVLLVPAFASLHTYWQVGIQFTKASIPIILIHSKILLVQFNSSKHSRIDSDLKCLGRRSGSTD